MSDMSHRWCKTCKQPEYACDCDDDEQDIEAQSPVTREMAEETVQQEPRLSEIEIALIDAFKSLADVLMAMNPNAVKALTASFEHQRNGKLETGQPNAAAVFEHLRLFVADPKRQANRERIRQLLTAPPQGRA